MTYTRYITMSARMIVVVSAAFLFHLAAAMDVPDQSGFNGSFFEDALLYIDGAVDSVMKAAFQAAVARASTSPRTAAIVANLLHPQHMLDGLGAAAAEFYVQQQDLEVQYQQMPNNVEEPPRPFQYPPPTPPEPQAYYIPPANRFPAPVATVAGWVSDTFTPLVHTIKPPAPLRPLRTLPPPHFIALARPAPQQDMKNDTFKPEVVLYDLACIHCECFSPVVWRIRLMLNYKQIPYRTVFVEFPDIEPTLKALGISPASSEKKYSVPAIYHQPSNKYIMDSDAISKFLEFTYPEPSLQLSSDLGTEIEAQGRAVLGPVLSIAVPPREIDHLSPRTAEYFRRTREARWGHTLESLIEGDNEEQAWTAAQEGMKEQDKLIKTNRAEGPFVLGAMPSYTDFFIAGVMESTRIVHEASFRRHMKEVEGTQAIYEACLPWMVQRD
nr:hypothetical protein B0A51_08516 [Rachicladosporium sp. CCFEE 5018]